MLSVCSFAASAQMRSDLQPLTDEEPAQEEAPTVLTLEDALKIALSENISVKVADEEIKRNEYAKKGTYASLFPQISASGSFQRTIKKQVMYMDSGGDGGGFMSMFQPIFDAIAQATGKPIELPQTQSSSNDGGMSVGRWNTFNGGINASLTLVNAQLWKNLKISGQSVELAVEKARSSRLDMVTQVKQAYYAILMAKEAFNVYKSVYENAVENFNLTEKKYKAQKASELELTRSKTNVANAIPNVYNAESSITLALWQLKAVIGIDLDKNIDVAGSLADYSETMFRDIHENDDFSLEDNSTMRQLAIQAEQLAETVKLQKFAYIPTLSTNFSYSMNAMTNDFKFREFKWTPYSYVGLSLSIPIFSGGKRYQDVRQAKVQAVELDMQKVDTERQLRISIQSDLNTMETNMKSYNSAREAVSLAQKSYDITSKSYEVGKSTLTDLNDAQLSLTQARLSESQAIYNFVVAKSSLEKTLGHDFIDEEGNPDMNGNYGK